MGKSLSMQIKRIILFLCLISTALTGTRLLAASGWDGEYLIAPGKGVSTSHEDIAKPYARGKIRVFILIAGHHAFEVNELRQRADIECEAMTAFSGSELGYLGDPRFYNQLNGVTPREKEIRLLRYLSRPWDVIVMGGVSFSALPPLCRYLLLDAVNKGTGLVTIRGRDQWSPVWEKRPALPEAEKILVKGMPFEGLSSYTEFWMKTNGAKFSKPIKRTLDGKEEIVGWDPPFNSSMLEDLIRCHQVGKGRFVSFEDKIRRGSSQWGFGPSSLGQDGDVYGGSVQKVLGYHGLEGRIDYHMGLLFRMICWAAGREPSARIENLPAGTLKAKSETQIEVPLKFNYDESAPKSGYSLRWQLKDDLNHILRAGKAALSGRPADFSLQLPALPGGKYFANLWLDSAGGVEDWGHIYLNIEPRIALGEIIPDKEYFEANESVTGKVKAPEGASVRCSLIDSWDRKYSQQTVVSQQGEAVFKLPLQGTRSMYQIVEAELLGEDGTAIDLRRTVTFVPVLREGEYLVDIWHESGKEPDIEYKSNGRVLWDEYGLNTLQYGDVKRNTCGIHREHWLGRPDIKNSIKDINDEAGFKSHFTQIEDFARTARRDSQLTLLVADEVGTGYMPVTASSLKAFHAWLKNEYSNVAALNASWGTKFGSFEDVPFLNQWLKSRFSSIADLNKAWRITDEKQCFKDFESVPADHWKAVEELRKSAPSWWFDMDRFSRINTAQFIAKTGEIMHRQAPHLRNGIQYARMFSDDCEIFARSMQFFSSVSPETPDLPVMRDLAGSKMLLGGYTGGYLNQRTKYRRMHWLNLFTGMNYLGNFFEEVGAESVIAGDGSLAPYLKPLTPDFRAIAHEGLGKWIVNAKRLDCGIAMLHDYRSCAGNQLVRDFGDWAGCHQAMSKLCDDAGLPFHYIGGRELEEGILEKEKFHTLLLPSAISISAKQAGTIRRFIENGGVVVADIACGVLDGHGKIVPDGMLAEVFGVKQNLTPNPKFADGIIGRYLRTEGKPEISEPAAGVLELSYAVANPSVQATTAKSSGRVGDAPVYFANNLGKGRAYLLNLAPYTYVTERGNPNPDLNGCLNSWKTMMGVAPLYQLLDQDNKYIGGIEVANEFEIDGKRLFGLLPDRAPPAGRQPHLKLDRVWHVYDILQKKYLGETDRIKFEDMADGVPACFGLSPYKIEKVEASFTDRPERGRTVNLSVKIKASAQPGKHLLYLRLLNPSGKDCYWMDARPFTENGAAEIPFAFAADEPAGKYTLTVTDVISQQGCQLNFEITPSDSTVAGASESTWRNSKPFAPAPLESQKNYRPEQMLWREDLEDGFLTSNGADRALLAKTWAGGLSLRTSFEKANDITPAPKVPERLGLFAGTANKPPLYAGAIRATDKAETAVCAWAATDSKQQTAKDVVEFQQGSLNYENWKLFSVRYPENASAVQIDFKYNDDPIMYPHWQWRPQFFFLPPPMPIWISNKNWQTRPATPVKFGKDDDLYWLFGYIGNRGNRFWFELMWMPEEMDAVEMGDGLSVMFRLKPGIVNAHFAFHVSSWQEPWAEHVTPEHVKKAFAKFHSAPAIGADKSASEGDRLLTDLIQRQLAMIKERNIPLTENNVLSDYLKLYGKLSGNGLKGAELGEYFKKRQSAKDFSDNLASVLALYLTGHDDTEFKPAPVTEVRPGLNYEYFESNLSSIDGVSKLEKPTETGETDEITLTPARRNDGFALRYTGFLEVPRWGAYRFQANADDGMRVWLSDKLLVEKTWGLNKVGEIILKPGRYPLRVEYYQTDRQKQIQLLWEGPQIPKQEIPASALCH
jgi:hypothetical protein